MGKKITAATEVAAALKDLWNAQSSGDPAAQAAALDRGHRAIRGNADSGARQS